MTDWIARRDQRLFPDSFEESELGESKLRWNVVGLSHYLLLQRGFDLPAKKRIKGAYPVVAASGISSSHNSPMAKAPGVVTGDLECLEMYSMFSRTSSH